VGIWLFLTHPEQRRLMAEDPGLVKGAVEEVLRWTTPTRNRLRIANADHDFHGKRIRAGDWVVGMLPAANRDERVFEHPDRFDVRRTPNEHLSFGAGIHMCLGRALARLELATLLPRVFEVLPDIELATPDDPPWIVDASASGFSRMPVVFTPAEVPVRQDAS